MVSGPAAAPADAAAEDEDDEEDEDAAAAGAMVPSTGPNAAPSASVETAAVVRAARSGRVTAATLRMMGDAEQPPTCDFAVI